MVVNVPLSVDSLSSLSLFLWSDMLLNYLGGSLGADLGGVSLAVALEELFDACSDTGHCKWI
jgi:deoxyxylulose-5-phosphate synthase